MDSSKPRSPSDTELPQLSVTPEGREDTPNWPELLELPENLGELVAAFNLHIARARRLPREEHLHFRQDAAQLLLNVAYNAEKLRHSSPSLSTVEQEVDETGQAPNRQEVGGTGQAPNRQELVADYLSLARALLAADRRCRSALSTRERSTLMQRVDELQRCAYLAAHACACLGLLPAFEVRAISKQHEPFRQCSETLALYRRHPEIIDKTPMSPTLLEELEQGCQNLLQLFGDACDQNSEHQQDCNALWTLLVRQHDAIWHLGTARWGARIDAKLRSLYFRPLRSIPA